ncbi:OsmC family protein [Candidatus Phytoplasma prunorum]|uniref:OsmC family protein n=1 Tax=Candidatus Phytoplasma prunorum TaxID=47565 RepID=UPI002FEECCE1
MAFQVTVFYEKKLNDFIFIKDNIKNKLTSALTPNNQNQSDPQELFCLSWIICFYKTSKKILLQKGFNDLDIKINLVSNVHKDKQGFYFELILKIGIESFSLKDSKVILEATHQKCPISRIINNYNHLKIFPVDYKDISIN